MSKETITSDKSKAPVFWRITGSENLNEQHKECLTLTPQKFYGVREAPTGWWLMAQQEWDHLESVTAEFDKEEFFQKLRPTLHWVKNEGKTRLAVPTIEEAIKEFKERPGSGTTRLKAMLPSLTEDEMWKLGHGLKVVRVIEEPWTPGSLPKPLGLEF